MRINRNTAYFLPSLLLLFGLTACSGAKSNNDAAVDTRILVSTQCDMGAAINPTSARVNYGDRPVFNITLSGGYSIQTIYCTSGGSLVGTQFTMGSVQGADNVHVVTQTRWVGSSAPSEVSEPMHSIVFGARGTESISASQFASSDIVASVDAEAGVKLMLSGELFGKTISVPLTEQLPGKYEARFVLADLAPQKEGEPLPDMLHFSIVRESEAEAARAAYGTLFIAVRK